MPWGPSLHLSTAIMLPVMYLNTYSTEQVYFSQMRTFMAVVMGAVMALVMLAFIFGASSDIATRVAAWRSIARVDKTGRCVPCFRRLG